MTVIRSRTIPSEENVLGGKSARFHKIYALWNCKAYLEYITCRGGLTYFKALRKEQLDCSRTSLPKRDSTPYLKYDYFQKVCPNPITCHQP